MQVRRWETSAADSLARCEHLMQESRDQDERFAEIRQATMHVNDGGSREEFAHLSNIVERVNLVPEERFEYLSDKVNHASHESEERFAYMQEGQ